MFRLCSFWWPWCSQFAEKVMVKARHTKQFLRSPRVFGHGHTKQFLRSPKVFGHEHKPAPRNPPVLKNARFSPRENRKLYCPHCDREAKGWLHSASSRDTPALDLLRWPQCCRCTEAPLCLYKLPASTPRITRLCSPPRPSWLQIVQAPAVHRHAHEKKSGGACADSCAGYIAWTHTDACVQATCRHIETYA